MKRESSLRKRSTVGDDEEEQSLLGTPSKTKQAAISAAQQLSISLKRSLSSLHGSGILLILFLLLFLLNVAVLSRSLQSTSSIIIIQETESHKQNSYRYPDVIYGHAHIAKTAGTSLNGNLSMHFERICGNKGYSLDAIGANQRFMESNQTKLEYVNDSYTKLVRGYNRGRVPHNLMPEIGFQDCDWISHEIEWTFWLDIANGTGGTSNSTTIPLELHVPCRSPVDHLMSQCNWRHRKFDCNKKGGAMMTQIRRCVLYIKERFSNALNETFDTKCYDFRKTDAYMDWMGKRLQRRRVEADYAFRESNANRKKEQECVWNRPDIQKLIVTHLLETYDYYKFCDKCLGSEQDLFATQDNNDK